MGHNFSHHGNNLPIRVYVTYPTTQTDRQVLLPKGSGEAALQEAVLEHFNDIIPPNKSEYTLLWFDGKEYVKLAEGQKLKDLDKVKIVLEDKSSSSDPVIPHPIVDTVPYLIWSFISQQHDGLLKKSPTDNKVLCDGNESDPPNLVKFTAKDVSISGKTLYAFTLPIPGQPNKVYALSGQGENKDVLVQELSVPFPNPFPSKCSFEIQQSFSFTQFRCDNVGGRVDLYLNASKSGKVTLTKAGQAGYPNVNTLFITRKDI